MRLSRLVTGAGAGSTFVRLELIGTKAGVAVELGLALGSKASSN